MAHLQSGDLAPYGESMVMTPSRWMPEPSEPTDCARCGRELPFFEELDEDGNRVGAYGREESRSKGGAQCCSQACAQLEDLDVRGGLKMLAAYLRSIGSETQATLAESMLERHSYALGKDGWNIEELIRESAA